MSEDGGQRAAMSHVFNGLNGPQTSAVTHGNGPLLIAAGPGTGKTLTLVRRIAFLIHRGIRPGNILALTFTNRAAREMRERTEALLGKTSSGTFIGTFHLLGLRIIRDCRGGEFGIYSRDEQVDLVKSLKKCPAGKARQVVDRIARIRNGVEAPDAELQAVIGPYQDALRKNNAFDFDDLILEPIELLSDEALLRKYRDRFTHIIVDEYQDINPAQYKLLRLLAGESGAVYSVGDPDQAIYAFRGADVRNFLNFENDFPGASRITLNENYRSSGLILNAADSVIKNNQERIDKQLSPTREESGAITVVSVPDDREEGAVIIREIEARMGGTSHYRIYAGVGAGGPDRSCRFSDFAVIYRTRAQARALEEAFLESGIPYQVIGKQGGLQRKEADETIAWLRSFLPHPEGDAGPLPQDAQEAKLLSPADFFDPRADAVALMTMHMAKGLEFKTVFIAGVEEGLVPSTLNADDVDIEEERRLFYVGMTRAMDELFLLHARSRFLYGQKLAPAPSRFLAEIPKKLLKTVVIPDRIKKEQKQNKQLGLF